MKYFLWTAALAYIGLSLWSLDKMPTFYGDESIYCEPIWNLTRTGHMGTIFYPDAGGFDKSTLINGRIFAAIQVPILKLFGWSVFSLRLQSFLAGLGVLFLTYLIVMEIAQTEAIALLSVILLALSHLFIFASHFARPDMTCTLFILGAVYLFLTDRYFLAGLVAALTLDIHPPGGVVAMAVLGALCIGK